MSLFDQIDRRVQEFRQTVSRTPNTEAERHFDFVCRACGEGYAEDREVCEECGREAVERADGSE